MEGHKIVYQGPVSNSKAGPENFSTRFAIFLNFDSRILQAWLGLTLLLRLEREKCWQNSVLRNDLPASGF